VRMPYLARRLRGDEEEERDEEDEDAAGLDVDPDGLAEGQRGVVARALLGLDLVADVGGAQGQGGRRRFRQAPALGALHLGRLARLLGVARGGEEVLSRQHGRQNLLRLGVEGAKVELVAGVHDADLVALGQKLDLVRDEHDGLVGGVLLEAVFKDVLRRVVVDRGQGVVEQVDVAVEVGRAGEVEALALATRQVNATQTSLGLVPLGEDLQVQLQGAIMDDLARAAAAGDGLVSKHCSSASILGTHNLRHDCCCQTTI